MVRKCLGFVVIVGMLLVAAPSVGAAGATQHYGPFASNSTDHGSCSQPWATDTDNRDFMVQENKDGTFTVREEYKDGTFVTSGGASPGACDTKGQHGTIVGAGITGSFHGDLEGVVTGANYNANGCVAASADCATTEGFIAAVFGPRATFSCLQGYANCTFRFHYAAGDEGLIYHEWTDESTNPPGGETFTGDIASA